MLRGAGSVEYLDNLVALEVLDVAGTKLEGALELQSSCRLGVSEAPRIHDSRIVLCRRFPFLYERYGHAPNPRRQRLLF